MTRAMACFATFSSFLDLMWRQCRRLEACWRITEPPAIASVNAMQVGRVAFLLLLLACATTACLDESRESSPGNIGDNPKPPPAKDATSASDASTSDARDAAVSDAREDARPDADE
jgi:hypothetical protein